MIRQGLALLTLQAHYPRLHPPACDIFDPTAHCEKVKGGNAAFLFISLYLLAAGSAGIKAALPAHGADQFDERDPVEAGMMSGFFNFLLMAICLGGTISLTLFIWIQQNKGWDWGFGLSSISMFLAMIVFTAGLPTYRIHMAKRTNALVEIIQVLANPPDKSPKSYRPRTMFLKTGRRNNFLCRYMSLQFRTEICCSLKILPTCTKSTRTKNLAQTKNSCRIKISSGSLIEQPSVFQPLWQCMGCRKLRAPGNYAELPRLRMRRSSLECFLYSPAQS